MLFLTTLRVHIRWHHTERPSFSLSGNREGCGALTSDIPVSFLLQHLSLHPPTHHCSIPHPAHQTARHQRCCLISLISQQHKDKQRQRPLPCNSNRFDPEQCVKSVLLSAVLSVHYHHPHPLQITPPLPSHPAPRFELISFSLSHPHLLCYYSFPSPPPTVSRLHPEQKHWHGILHLLPLEKKELKYSWWVLVMSFETTVCAVMTWVELQYQLPPDLIVSLDNIKV